MKNFQTVVQELLHNHERQRRYIALLTALCMLMAFTVSIILIEPAESMTGELACGMSEHIHNENCFTYTCGLEDDENHVHSAECRKLTCGKTEHAHSENCYIHEDEQTAQIMQINSPQIIDNDTPEGDSGISSHTDKPKDAWLDENQAFKEALKEPPEGAHEIEYNPANPENDEVTELEVSVNVQKAPDGYHIESQSDSQKVKFLLHYTIDKSFIKEDGNQYIYIKIPDGFDIPDSWFGINHVVVDDEGYTSPNNDHTAGYFSIDKDTRMLVIRFTDDYVTKKLSDSGTFSGKVEFEGSFNRDNTADGDKEFTLWNDKIVIDFPEKTYYAEKEGKIKPADDAGKNPKVEWTITVNNYYPADETNTLTDYTVRDGRFPKNGDGVTVEPKDLGEWVTEGDSTYYKFNEGVNSSQVTFTFTEELTKDEVDAKNVSNTVDLQKNGSSVSTKNVDITVDDKPTLDKKGVAKYPVDGKDYIEWTITVTNPLGGSLKDYYLTDNAFENMEAKDITISPTGTPFEFTPTDKKLKFTSDVTDVTITYKQFPTPDHDSYYSNYVELYKDNNKIGSKDYGLNYYEKYTLDKSGDYNADTKEITWTVKASTDQNDNNVTLDGYTLQDNALIGKTINDITITNSTFGGNTLTASRNGDKIILSKTAGWGGDTNAGNYAEVTLDSTTGTITIKGIDGRCIKNLDFTYTTKADEADASGTKGTVKNGDKIINTVTDSKNVSKNGEVTVKSRNFVEKKFLGDTAGNMKADVYGKENRTLNWQVDLTQDEGFSGTKTFVDVMSATGGGDHYLDLNSDSDSQKNSIHLKAKVNESDTEWTELHEGTDYEIKYYADSSSSEEIEAGHANRFEIIFKKKLQNSDGKDYHYVEITYQTTADISKAEFDKAATFNNTVRYNETENPPITGYEITPHDSTKVQTFSLNVTKSWKDNENAAGIRPDSVKFYLERKLGSGDWEKIYKKDGKWEKVTSETEDYTFTIEKDSWQYLLENLPIDTDDHEQQYFYRVREVGVDEDIYTVTYSDPDGVKGTINGKIDTTITNTKKMTFDKVVLGADGQPLKDGKLDLNALGSVEITEEHNGTKTTGSYYVIGYQFTIYDSDNNYRQFVDTLPDGFTLAFTEDKSINGQGLSEKKQYHPVSKSGTYQYYLTYNNDLNLYGSNFTYKDNKITFNINNGNGSITYYIKAPADDPNNAFSKQFKSAVEKTVTVKNTITDKNGTEKSAEVKVTGQIKDNPLRDILKKDVNNISENGRHKSDNGVVSYSVYVNPEGKNLSNSDELDVLDDLIFGDFTGIDPFDKNKLTAELQNVQVEKVENFKMENGSPKADSVEILPESDYSYTTEEGFSETTEEDVKYNLIGGEENGGYAYKYNSALVGDDITLTIVGEPNYTFDWRTSSNGIDGFNLNGSKIPENGILSLKVKANASSISIWIGTEPHEHIKSVSMTAHRTTTTDIASRLTVSVPDETPLKITYSYKLMYDNQELSGDVTAKLSNKASITSGTSTATDSKNDVEFYVNKVESTVGTGNLPKIVKYNIGNVATNPSAIFYLAKYENSKWKFANEETTEEIRSSSGEKIGTKHTFTYGKEVSDNSIPPSKDESNSDGALKLQITDADPFYLELDSSVLYKLIEIKAPDGYEANDDDVKKLNNGHYQSLQELLEGELNNYLSNPSEYSNANYKNLLNKFIAVHYFKYGSQEVTGIESVMPKDSKYQVVGIGGSVEIPNSELIDIGTQKIWDSGENGSVEVELLWSHKKSSNGIPSDAVAVEKEKFALSDEHFNATQMLNSDNGYTYTWHNLPNGYDDKPIYYYVRETSYTINGEKFEWNKDTGKYMCGEKEGEYKPIYTGNGTNKSAKPDSTRSGESTATDNGVIKIHNSKGLQVKKIWKNSDNTTMATADIPNVEIKFNLYGTTSDGVTEWIYQGTLSKDNWTAEIPEDLVDDNAETNPSKTTLSDYVSFEVEELIEGELITKLYQYTISYNYNISGTTGEITITNKNPNPTKVDVSVEKVWSDGNDKHEGIDVKLYKSDTAISDADLANITNPESDSRLKVVTGEGITNPIALNDSNNWKHTWNDLPFKGEGVSKYYYYAIETRVPTGYTASYFVNGNKTTITNSVPGSLTIDKKWFSKDGTDITSEITDKANFKLYRRANSSAAADEDKKLDNLKIYAFGDSITFGTNSSTNYSKELESMLKNNYSGIVVDNKSTPGDKIEAVEQSEVNASQLNDSYNVVLLIAGTNNVIHTNQTSNEMMEKMESLINSIYEKSQNKDLIVFVGSIPKISRMQDGTVYRSNPSNGDDRRTGAGYNGETDDQVQAVWDKLVPEYNQALYNLVNVDYPKKYPDRKIIYVNTGEVASLNLSTDGLHPNEAGHKAMAQAFYNAILEAYNINSKVPVGVNGLPSDFYKNGVVNTDLYEEVTDKAFTLSSENGWSETIKDLDKKDENGNDYVYYIVEETTGKNWTAAYTGNGQIIGNEGATITVTNTIDKGSIDVEKVWKNANGSEYTPNAGDTVEVQLYRSTTKPESELRTSSIMNEPMALADDGIMLTSFEGSTLTIGEPDEESGNILKYLIPAGDYNWITIQVTDSMKDKKVSKIECPAVSGNGTGFWQTITNPASGENVLTYSTPIKLEELNSKGFSGNWGDDAYLIITLAEEESEGGDTGGGGTGGGNTGETNNPTPPQGGKTLELNTISNEEKEATINDVKAGDVITINLKGTPSLGINGCFGLSYQKEDGEWGWKQEDWNSTINSDGIATITWTAPAECKSGVNVQFKIWYNNASVDSATYTVTSGGTTPTEPPTEPDTPDPEPTDSHIPEGAIKVDEYTLKSTDNWKHTFTDLPLTDASGNPYYYYVKEVNVPDGFEVTYSDGVEPGGTITITNTKKESSTTTMPSTGGNGARKYYTVGGMLLLMSACGWAMHRRKRVIPH